MKALLLDLDNTLLDIDFGRFMEEYMLRISRRFSAIASDKQLQRQLIASTRAMIENEDRQRTVFQAFIDDFFSAAQLPAGAMDAFVDFYETEFPKLRHWARPMPGGRALVEAAFARELTVVIATAPLFPLAAIKERLRWAEVDDFDYALITSADTMSFSKPSPRYYQEIAERLGVHPSDCVMIGDESLMDGPAAEVGMKVMLVGPERPSNMTPWFGDMFDEDSAPALPRYPSLEVVMSELRSSGEL